MRRFFLFIIIILFLVPIVKLAAAQSNQTVNNGAPVGAIAFPGTGCVYNWTNDTPGIGLAVSGTGNIGSFTAVNTGGSAVTATITATPAASGYAYIANLVSNNVSVISVATNAVVATVQVGQGPFGVSATGNSKLVYVTNAESNNVSVINTTTNTVEATIPVGKTPYGVAASLDGTRVYVANYYDNTVSVINGSTNKVIATISVGQNPYGIAISPDGTRLYVGYSGGNSVVNVINTENNQILTTIPVVFAAQHMVVSPDGDYVYASNIGYSNVGTGDVSKINTKTYTVESVVPVGTQAEGISISPDGTKVYVACWVTNSVSVVNTITNTVTATITGCAGAMGTSVSADGSLVYVADENSNSVSVIDAQTNSIVGTVLVGELPDPQGNFFIGNSICTPVKFTITVNPAAAVPPAITAGTSTGAITACAGTASVSPNVQQFTMSGSNLTGVVTVTAPPDFEVSLTAGGTYSNSITLAQTSNLANTTIYVRSASTAPAGTIAGNVVISSPGATSQNVAVTGTVYPLPVVNAIAPQTVSNGAATTAINFTGTGNAYTWDNDTPGIGLAASGMGDISSFTAVNTGNTPIKATVTVTPALAPYAYITKPSGVSVINTLTNTAVPGIIPVPNAYGVAVSPDGASIYISGEGPDGIISIISTLTNKVIGTIDAGYNLGNETMSADGSELYIASGPGSVLVISTKTNSVVNTIPADNPSDIALSADGSKLWVVTSYSGIISIINTATNAIINSVTVGLQPLAVALSPDGSLAYVTVANSNYISVINTATYKVVTTIPVGVFPSGEVLNANGSLLYVNNEGSNTVSVINTLTNIVVATVGVGTDPAGIAISPDGSQLIVTSLGSGNVYIINTTNNKVIATVPVGDASGSLGNFIANNTGCSGTADKFTIIVNPSVPTITNSAAYGTISACIGTASASPYIQQFTVSGIGLTDNITATAPVGFQISLVPGSGYAGSIVLAQTAGVVDNTVIYVRSAATATAGGISGSVILTAAGASSETLAVTGTVNGPLTVNGVTNQTVNNGEAIAPVNFIGTGNTVDWVNNTPAIGLAASGSGNIASFTVINTGNSPVVATITATPLNSGYAYMANNLYNTVSVVSTVNNTIAATLPVGAAPFGVAVSPDGSTVYVTNSGTNIGTGSATMSEINTATNTVTTVQVGPEPYGIVLSPDGKLAYVAVSNFNFADYCNLAVFNTFTNTVVTYIPIGINPVGVAINADGSKVYVANSTSGTVSVINTATNTVIANIAMDSPIGIAISPDGKTLYVTNFQANTVSVVDASTDVVTANINVGKDPQGISISPDGSKVYVANIGSNTVSVINTVNNAVTATIAVASNPNGLCVSPDGDRVYAGSSVINTATNTVVATVTVPNASFGNFVSAPMSCGGASAKFTITVNPSLPTITVTVATGIISACAGTVSASPNIQQFAVSGIGLTGNITATAPAGFEVSLSSGSGYGNSIILSQTGGAVSNTPVYVRSAASLANGTTTASVILSSPGAPSQTVSVTGLVNLNVTASLVISASENNVCAGTQITFTATPTNGGSSPVYQWLLNGNNASTSSPTFSSSTFTNGDVVSCVMTSSGACVAPANITSNSVTINVNADVIPSINIVASQNTVCAGTMVTFTATQMNGGSVPVYQWLVNGNNAGTNNATYSNSNLADGDKVSCMITSNALCAAPATVTSNSINMSVSPLVSPAISIEASANSICAGANVTFTATPGNGGSSPVYQWLLNGNNIGSNSPAFSSSTLANGDVISCRISSNATCLTISDAISNNIIMVVNAALAPSLSINISANKVCAGTLVTFSASPANGGSSPVYQWLLNGNNAGSNSPTFSSSTFANGDLVSCVLTSNLTCAAPVNITSNTIIVNIFPLPVVTAGGNRTIEEGSSVTLTAIVSGDIADITWSPATGLNNNKILTPRASPSSSTSYIITVQSAAGCMASDSVTVTVLDGIVIPNTFTPNGDGINDTWIIKHLDAYPQCSVQIFTRWGQNVYTSTGYGIPWDGTYRGTTLPTGTYYYVIDLKNNSQLLSGFVAIVR